MRLVPTLLLQSLGRRSLSYTARIDTTVGYWFRRFLVALSWQSGVRCSCNSGSWLIAWTVGLLDMLLFIPGEVRFFAVVDTLPYRREVLVVLSVTIVMVVASRDAS